MMNGAISFPRDCSTIAPISGSTLAVIPETLHSFEARAAEVLNSAFAFLA
jgi:hypothetical protein